MSVPTPRLRMFAGPNGSGIRHSNRAYIFDNSTPDRDRTWLAEITEGRELELKTDRIPAWFRRAVLDQGADRGRGMS